MEKQATFLKWFEIHQILENDVVRISEVINKLQLTLTSKQWKTILSLGIRQCYENLPICDTTLHDIHNTLTSIKRSNESFSCGTNPTKATSAMKKVFEVDSLHCKMFEYLDFNTMKRCSMVNLQWLYAAYDPRSYYYFDTKDHYSQNRNGDCKRQSFSILRFRHAKVVKICQWMNTKKLERLFGNLVYFNKIREIIIERSKIAFTTIVQNIAQTVVQFLIDVV